MKSNVCTKIAQALRGEVDFGVHKGTNRPYTGAQKIEEMMGVTEQVATLPEVNPETGEVIRLVNHVYGKHIDPNAAKDMENVGPEAFGRAIMGSGFESEAIDELSAITTLSPPDGVDPRVVRDRLIAEHRIVTTYAGIERAPHEMTRPALRLSPHVDLHGRQQN